MFDAATKQDIREVKDEIRAVGVLVERIDAKVDAVIEGLTSTRDELKRDMASMEERLLARMAMIENVVSRHTKMLDDLAEQILALRVDMTNRFAMKDTEVADLDARTTALEKKVGIKS